MKKNREVTREVLAERDRSFNAYIENDNANAGETLPGR